VTACHCAEFSRAALLRGAAAQAGAGLPAIERGMPAPAGTGLSRRSLLARGAGLAVAVYGGSMLSPRAFEEGIAAARAAAPAGRILVSVFLAGGLDALSLLAPTGRAQYAALRPTLKVAPDPGDALPEDAKLQWHPSARPLRDLHAAGKLTVLPAIGYDDPNQSHFTSRHYWEVGELNPSGRVGWMGRLLDRHGAPDNPLQGLSLDYTLAPSLAPASVPVAAVGAPEDYDFWTRDVWDDGVNEKLLSGFGALGGLPTGDPELAAARGAASMSAALRAGLAPVRGTDPLALAQASYPVADDAFPRRLASLADMIAAACRSGAWRSRPTAATTPTTTSSAPCPATSRCSARRWAPSRLTSRRAASPTACSCTCGASSAAAPRRTAAGPTTAREASRWSWARGRRAASSASSPASPPASSTTAATCATPPTSARSTRRSWRAGSSRTRPASCPARRACPPCRS